MKGMTPKPEVVATEKFVEESIDVLNLTVDRAIDKVKMSLQTDISNSIAQLRTAILDKLVLDNKLLRSRVTDLEEEIRLLREVILKSIV